MGLKSTFGILVMTYFFGHLASTAQTKVIAHRGFSGVAPENTLISFQKAIEVGADYLEFDVHKSKDGKLFVVHDASVKRTSSNHATGNIAEMSSKAIRKVRVGYSEKFGCTFKNEKIPTLRKVLKLARHKMKVCVELKVGGIETDVLKTINDLDMHDEVIIFSFHYPILSKIRALDPKIPMLHLIEKADDKTIDNAKKINCNAIGVGYSTAVTPEFLESAHHNGIEVWKWTVNNEDEMRKLIHIGIDGIITNYPDKALEILKKHKNRKAN